MTNELQTTLDALKADYIKTGELNQKLAAEVASLQKDMLELAKKGSANPTTHEVETKSIGQQFVESDNYQAMVKGGHQNSGKVAIKTITNPTLDTTQPLVSPQRVGQIFTNPNRVLRIRDLLPTLPTSSNLVEFAKENVFTNSAAIQFSSPTYEGVSKAESGITFTLGTAPVRTIAHWVGVSKQILQDAAGLQAYIEGRLTYGLGLKEETEILTGNNNPGELNGLTNQATAYDTSLNVSGDTKLDKLRHAIYQATLSEYVADGIVMNPLDFEVIELIKTEAGGANKGKYVFGDPTSAGTRFMWGVPCVVTNSMPSGTFLVGAFAMGAAIYDAMQTTVEVSTSHASFFIQNLAAILCERREALAVYRPAAFIYGSY